jgi:hypothetical protein
MGKGRLHNWRRWLQTFSLGLLFFAILAPLPDTLARILQLVAVGGTVTYLMSDSPESRKETALFLITLTALVLLALLVSIDPRWVIFGSLGIYAGATLWDVLRQEHAEYLAERKRLR